jgi:N-acetylneuraminic acid mutarotase
MKNKRTTESAFLNPRVLIPVLLCIAAVGTLLGVLRPEASMNNSQRTLTFAERVAYQRAIEEVYWRHRIWPKENINPKPALDAVMSQAHFEKKVEDYLRSTETLQNHWQRPITAEDLQAEMDRMAESTRQPEVLRELFNALGDDPFLVAECLAKPLLSERLITSLEHDQRKGRLALSEVGENSRTQKVTLTDANYALPTISDATTGCIPDNWTSTNTNAPSGRIDHTAVWTGSEMIVWGGYAALSSGGRYNPSTDSWTATSTTNAPSGRHYHTAVWTGTEMIVWGGSGSHVVNTGGRYNPSTDSWTATSIANAPSARHNHTAVWTGSEMIVWGGFDGNTSLNTGGIYSPDTDVWTATSTVGAPSGRYEHTAVWTTSEMIVWGGQNLDVGQLDTGGRYNPSTDSWTGTTTTSAPQARNSHTAVWSGSEMIVWGGVGVNGGVVYLNTGGRYNLNTDSWTATSTTNAPSGRFSHTAVWTGNGNEMIVWGGSGTSGSTNTGGRYDPSTDSWTATSITNAPEARFSHTAVWTNSEMIVWGGGTVLNTGGRYCALSATATPTPTPTATVTPTATSTASPTPTPCMGRCTPTPRPRPTPAPRP